MVSAIFSSENPDIILTSSDDQTVKGWDLNKVKSIKPPNKKRPKTRKKKDGNDSDSEQDDDGSETYTNTITEKTGHDKSKRGFDAYSKSKGNLSEIKQDDESDDSVDAKKNKKDNKEFTGGYLNPTWKPDINTTKTAVKDPHKENQMISEQGNYSEQQATNQNNQQESSNKTNKTLEGFDTPSKFITKK